MAENVEMRVLRAGDEAVLDVVAADVFDNPLEPRLVREFLSDPRHHLAVALEGTTVIGFASAVHYVHPDKPAELWVNEVGVADSHQRAGIAKRLLQSLFQEGQRLGCTQAWVLTDQGNSPANKLYASLGGWVEDGARTVMYTFDLKSEEE